MKRFSVLFAALVVSITLTQTNSACAHGGHGGYSGHGGHSNSGPAAQPNTTKNSAATKGPKTTKNAGAIGKGTPPSHWRGHYHSGYGAVVYTDPDDGSMYIWDAENSRYALIEGGKQ